MIAAPAFAASQVSISIDAGKPGPVIVGMHYRLMVLPTPFKI